MHGTGPRDNPMAAVSVSDNTFLCPRMCLDRKYNWNMVERANCQNENLAYAFNLLVIIIHL